MSGRHEHPRQGQRTPRKERHRPPITAGEWVGGQLPAPAYVTTGDPYRVELILWLEMPGDDVVGTEVVDPHAPASVTQIP